MYNEIVADFIFHWCYTASGFSLSTTSPHFLRFRKRQGGFISAGRTARPSVHHREKKRNILGDKSRWFTRWGMLNRMITPLATLLLLLLYGRGPTLFRPHYNCYEIITLDFQVWRAFDNSINLEKSRIKELTNGCEL